MPLRLMGIFFKQIDEGFSRSVQAAHYSTNWNLEYAGHITVGEPFQVNQRQHLALLKRQAANSTANSGNNFHLPNGTVRFQIATGSVIIQILVGTVAA